MWSLLLSLPSSVRRGLSLELASLPSIGPTLQVQAPWIPTMGSNHNLSNIIGSLNNLSSKQLTVETSVVSFCLFPYCFLSLLKVEKHKKKIKKQKPQKNKIKTKNNKDILHANIARWWKSEKQACWKERTIPSQLTLPRWPGKWESHHSPRVRRSVQTP